MDKKFLAVFLLAGCAAAPRPKHDKLEPMLVEALRFPTVAGNDQARRDQQAWLLRTAADLGFEARDAGPVTEIELPGPPGAPVLGLVVHGDVQPVEEKAWSVPPFAGVVRDGEVFGRGAADDKGPLVQALLAMDAIRGLPRTHTVRLLVGSDEESGSSDMKEYLKSHEPPAFSLVLDSEFPAVVGEKAWDGLSVSTPQEPGIDLQAGLAPSIVPDYARATIRWSDELEKRLGAKPLDPGTRLELTRRSDDLDVIVHGRSAHAGVNLAGGRNALVSLAHVLAGELPAGGAADLLAFAAHAPTLQLPGDPAWRGWDINVATLTRKDGKYTMVINLRRPPPLTAAQSRDLLFTEVRKWSPRLQPGAFFFGDEPLVFDTNAKLVRRLMAAYARATGEPTAPAISGGGTYAKRLPHSIAYGMWFPGKPYPGHDVDEHISLADLRRGLDVLVVTLRDLACGPPIQEPFKP